MVVFARDGESLQLPQDVADGDVRGVPDLAAFTGTVKVWAARHAQALRSDSFVGRAEACWGLVACGTAALPWCEAGLLSGDEDRQSDAGGVLRWVGVPPGWKPWLRALLDRLPDSEAADVLLELMPEIPAADAEPELVGEEGLLFGGRLLPFTEPIESIDAPLEAVVADARRWIGGLPGRSDAFVPLMEPLEVMLERLEPFAMPAWKSLLVATRSGWTATFGQGSGAQLSQVATRLGCRWVDTHYSRHVVRDKRVVQYGDRKFAFYETRQNHRWLQATQQGRWQWEVYGEPLALEDLAAYEAKRIPDRLTLQRVNGYCHAVGIERADPDFYLPKGMLIVQDRSSWPRPPRAMTGRAWRAEHL